MTFAEGLVWVQQVFWGKRAWLVKDCKRGSCQSQLPGWLLVAEELLEKLMSHRGKRVPDVTAAERDGWLPD